MGAKDDRIRQEGVGQVWWFWGGWPRKASHEGDSGTRLPRKGGKGHAAIRRRAIRVDGASRVHRSCLRQAGCGGRQHGGWGQESGRKGEAGAPSGFGATRVMRRLERPLSRDLTCADLGLRKEPPVI